MTDAAADARRDRLLARQQAERHTHRTMLRLLVCTAILRQCLTLFMPAAGAASWWMLPVLLLPGLICTLLFSSLMCLTGTQTLPQLLHAAVGQRAAKVFSVLIGLAILYDAGQTLQTLVALFTHGIGTVGTAFTLALLTCGMLLFCLHRDGLPRGIHILRWALAVMLSPILLDWLRQAGTDRLFPYLGGGPDALFEAARRCAGISWPLPLLLTEPPVKLRTSHLRELWLPTGFCIGFILMICLVCPHLLLTGAFTPTQALMAPFILLHNGTRTTGICLLMLCLFLLLAAEVRCAANRLEAAQKAPKSWLTCAMAGILSLSQHPASGGLQQLFTAGQTWLLILWWMLLAVCAFGILLRRRKR